MKKVPTRYQSAFSLIEVTLALAIFALAVVVITQAFVNTMVSLNTIGSESLLEADIKFARSQIIKETNRDLLEAGGQMETLSSGTVYWIATIEQAQVSDLFYVTLSLELQSPDDNTTNVFTQNLILLRPEWSDPIERSAIIVENSDRLFSNRLYNY